MTICYLNRKWLPGVTEENKRKWYPQNVESGNVTSEKDREKEKKCQYQTFINFSNFTFYKKKAIFNFLSEGTKK